MLLAIAGRSAGVWPGRTTTPAGGRATTAGRCAGCVTVGACRAWGTIRRGASVLASVRGCAIRKVGITGVAWGLRGGSGAETGGATGRGAGVTATGAAAGAAGAAAMAGTGGVLETGGAGGAICAALGCGGATTGFAGATTGLAAGATVTAGFAATGETVTGAGAGLRAAAAAFCSACLRSRMARAMSPGLDAREKSTFCLASAAAAVERGVALRPPVSKERTLAASSSSIEELCVFFSVTPTAVSASRISLLLTSSSRARSLTLTLLNPPSSPHIRA